MIYEIAEITVIAGQELAFEKAVAKASPYFQEAKGCLSLALQRVIESPNSYRLVVGWECVDDHIVGFRESAGFVKWRELASPFFAAAPNVCHVSSVLTGF